MTTSYNTTGTCSRRIHVDIDPDKGVINKVAFEGGCHGNTQGVARLVEGMNIDDAINRLEGIRCGAKLTSCPDQLAQALKQALQASRN